MRTAEGGFVELTQFRMVVHPARCFRRYDMKSYTMVTLRVEISKKIVRSGNHLKASTTAIPRHVYIPAVVRVLHESKRIFTFTVCKYPLYEMMDGTKIVNEICHNIESFLCTVCNK